MKNKSTILIIAVLFTLCLLAGCSAANYDELYYKKSRLRVNTLPVSAEGGRIEHIEYLFSDMPCKQANVYRLDDYILDRNRICENAKLLLGDDITTDEADGYFHVNSNQGTVITEVQSGSIKYLSTTFIEQDFQPIEKKLNNKEYIQKANEFIAQYNLKFETLNLSSAEVDTYMVFQEEDADGINYDVPVLMCVKYQHVPVDEIKFDGVGPKYAVIFDHTGSIVAVMSVWHDYFLSDVYPLSSFEDVKKMIANGMYSAEGLQGEVEVSINDVELVYYNQPLGLGQKYLVPYFKLTGKTKTKEHDVTIYVHAVEEEFLEIVYNENLYPDDTTNQLSKEEYLESETTSIGDDE